MAPSTQKVIQLLITTNYGPNLLDKQTSPAICGGDARCQKCHIVVSLGPITLSEAPHFNTSTTATPIEGDDGRVVRLSGGRRRRVNRNGKKDKLYKNIIAALGEFSLSRAFIV